MKLFVSKALICALLTYSQVTLADELYRCNNGYQDTPCRDTVSKKTVPITSNSPINGQQPITATVDADCKERGEAAKKISLLRDTGKTADQQIKSAPDDAALIQNIYNRHGAPLQVQNAIEHECMQNKEKDRLTKKQMIEAENLRNGGNVPSKNRPNNKTKLQPPTTTQKAEIKKEVVLTNDGDPGHAQTGHDQAGDNQTGREQKSGNLQPNDVDQKLKGRDQKIDQQNQGDELGICHAFKSGLDNIASEKRKGGDASHMSDLKQQQHQLEHEMKSAGC